MMNLEILYIEYLGFVFSLFRELDLRFLPDFTSIATTSPSKSAMKSTSILSAVPSSRTLFLPK